MIAYSFKFSAKKVLIFCVAIGIIAGGFFIGRNIINDNIKEASTITKESIAKFPKVKINDDRLDIAKKLGWEVEAEPIEIEEIIIPEEFDEVYEKYNDLQKEMGLDLSKYKGKKCKRYCYRVTNFDGEEDVHMNLLIYKDKIIGGDVSSTNLDGFMKSLIK